MGTSVLDGQAVFIGLLPCLIKTSVSICQSYLHLPQKQAQSGLCEMWLSF